MTGSAVGGLHRDVLVGANVQRLALKREKMAAVPTTCRCECNKLSFGTIVGLGVSFTI